MYVSPTTLAAYSQEFCESFSESWSDVLVERPACHEVSTQDSSTQKEENKYPRLKRDSNSPNPVSTWPKSTPQKALPMSSTPNIIRIIISRRVGWAKHVSRMVHKKFIQYFSRNPKGRNIYRRIKLDWLVLFRWVTKKRYKILEWINLVHGGVTDTSSLKTGMDFLWGIYGIAAWTTVFSRRTLLHGISVH
jgi:hypothetical protein